MLVGYVLCLRMMHGEFSADFDYSFLLFIENTLPTPKVTLDHINYS